MENMENMESIKKLESYFIEFKNSQEKANNSILYNESIFKKFLDDAKKLRCYIFEELENKFLQESGETDIAKKRITDIIEFLKNQFEYKSEVTAKTLAEFGYDEQSIEMIEFEYSLRKNDFEAYNSIFEII